MALYEPGKKAVLAALEGGFLAFAVVSLLRCVSPGRAQILRRSQTGHESGLAAPTVHVDLPLQETRGASAGLRANWLTVEHLDRDLAVLAARKDSWAQLPIGTKLEYLSAVSRNTAALARSWALAAADAKHLSHSSPLVGEEWISGPWATLYAINRYIRTLEEIRQTGSPQLPRHRVRVRPGGQVVADVFPVTVYDRLLLSGIRAEVWMQPDVTRDSLPQTMGTGYRAADRHGHLCLVLGAGNISSIAPLDILYKFVADGAVCILKMNPVNDYLGPIFERVFEPFVTAGYLRFAYGGSEIGRYLCSHDLIDEIHITGSDRTHDAIVFGSGPDAAERKRTGNPVLRKPITSELGNVSPTIVVPGRWSDADLRFQAENIATQKMHNAGFNCIASQVLILPRDWDGTPKLLAALAHVFQTTPARYAYYPGAADRQRRLREGHPNAVEYDAAETGVVPRTLLQVDADDPNDPALCTEAFCTVLAYVELPGDPASFLDAAVQFANERLWGTLGANLIVHPATQAAMPAAIDRAIAALRYGCVAVNAWTGVGFFITETPWGAYPGHCLADVGSGIGVVHNAHLFSRSQKSVIYAPFAPFPRSAVSGRPSLLPRPPWFITNRMQAAVGKALCEFEARPSPLRAAAVAALALRG